MDFLRSVAPRLENDKDNRSTTFYSGKPTQFLNSWGENSNISNELFGEITNQPTTLFGQKSNRSTNLFDQNSNISNNSMGAETNRPTNIMREYNNRSLNFVGRMINENRGSYYPSGPGFHRPTDSNADFVHIKILRNNTFVTLTDSKGNKKAGASVGILPGALKNSKNVPELTAEHVGRIARSMGVRSVVVKVNGFTKFSKKKTAIIGFREGYTHSRGNNHPIVYLEDTTRKAHNGCRLPKKQRK
jgi:small subunit ribosomal protein S11